MPIHVVSCYTYRTSVDSPWTDPQHSVNQFVAAIKEREVNGYGHVLVNGTPPRRRICADNAHEAREWFGEMGSRILNEADLIGPIILVPIPNSGCTMRSGHSRIAALARAIQEHSNLVEDVADVSPLEQADAIGKWAERAARSRCVASAFVAAEHTGPSARNLCLGRRRAHDGRAHPGMRCVSGQPRNSRDVRGVRSKVRSNTGG